MSVILLVGCSDPVKRSTAGYLLINGHWVIYVRGFCPRDEYAGDGATFGIAPTTAPLYGRLPYCPVVPQPRCSTPAYPTAPADFFNSLGYRYGYFRFLCKFAGNKPNPNLNSAERRS